MSSAAVVTVHESNLEHKQIQTKSTKFNQIYVREQLKS